MEVSGGSWIWSASLRYLFMVPFLLIIVGIRGNLPSLVQVMKEDPKAWGIWSMVGFGLFTLPFALPRLTSRDGSLQEPGRLPSSPDHS